MSRSLNPATGERKQAENSPIVWFSELLLAADRGDFTGAAHAQRQLARLGWSVARRKAARPKGGVQ
jgi:hypothetical protein